MCEDALTGGVAGGTENTEGTRPPHSPWAGPWRGPRNAAMGLQGLDQLLELRWKFLYQPSLCILANGHQPNPLPQPLSRNRTLPWEAVTIGWGWGVQRAL